MTTGNDQPQAYLKNIKQLHFDEWAGDGIKKLDNFLGFAF